MFIAFLYMFRTTLCPSSGENTRRRIGTVFSPDDGHIVARNM